MKRLRFNLTLFFGLLLTGAVVLLTAVQATSSPLIFVNYGALIIVFGGMVTVSLVMVPLKELRQLYKSLKWLLKTENFGMTESVRNILSLAQRQQDDNFTLSQASKEAGDIFLKEGLELLSLGMKSEDILRIFHLKMDTREEMNISQANFLMTLSKMGPGLGLVGTLLGMVSLFYQMGQGLGLEQIGPSMAIALCATLYGIASSNLVFLPLAEALIFKSGKEQAHLRLISDGLIMLKEKRHPIFIREALKSYLSGAEQMSLVTPVAREKERASA